MSEGLSVSLRSTPAASARAASGADVANEHDDLHELVAELRDRLGAEVALLARQPADERQPETLAVDAADGAALGRLPELLVGIARPAWRWSPVQQPISVSGATLRMTANLDAGGWATLVLQRRDGTGWNDASLRDARVAQGELDRYLRLWWRHSAARRRCGGLQAALDLHDIGVLLLDGGANLVFANRPAEAMLAGKDGLRQFGTTITATRVEDSVRLQTAILHAITQVDGERRQAPITLVHRRADAHPLIVAVLPIGSTQSDPADPAAVVYIIDPDAGLRGLIEPACRVYGLTGAEVRLARHLVEGATVAEAARLMRIKPQTAKAYLKQVFAKMGVHRQTDLVRVLLASLLRTSAAVELAVI
jgi:DNA-binding CsgD family transcriptional regulator